MQVNKNPWRVNGLIPIYSDSISSAEMKKGSKYDMLSLCIAHKLNYKSTNIFLECGCFQQDIFKIRGTRHDVILMDIKVNGILFNISPPYSLATVNMYGNIRLDKLEV